MEECFRQALNLLREPLCILDGDSKSVFLNDALHAFLGVPRDGSAVLATDDFWPDVAELTPAQQEAALEFRTRTGSAFLVKLSIARFGDFRLVRVVSGVSKSDPMQHFHSQRLETLGMLAGGVAHDFNNILTGILGHVTFLKSILPRSGNHVESLAAIEDGARKGSSITQQILTFSKLKLAEKATKLDFGDLVLKTCSLLRRAISPEYQMDCRIPDEQITILGIEGQLAQVIVNLVVNARDAVDKNGSISVHLEVATDQKELERVFGGLDLSSSRYARLAVTDNGHGISSDTLARIFEPYFSTKKDKGTGLGLSTVKAIVQSLGGGLEVKSALKKGTQVALYLPIVDGEVRAAEESRPGGIVRGANERILVVDDEYPVRNVLCVSLEHLGYRVETAASGVEALDLFTKNDERFDLVITDMLMPAMSGEQLFKKLQAIDPGVRVLAISGFSSEDAVRAMMQAGGKGFVQKPFTIEELSRQVRTCLDS